MVSLETTQTEHLCWRCHHPTPGSSTCSHCSAILPVPPEADYFSLLGLAEKRMGLERERLEEAFYTLSRQVHPDRYQTRSPEERQIAEERAAALNVAYHTLRDPLARTEYLLALEAGSADETQDPPPADLLHEIAELQETMEAYRRADEAGRGALEEVLIETRQALEARGEALVAELHEAFDLWDRRVVEDGALETKDHLLTRFREMLHRRRYLAKALQNISATLAGEPLPQPEGD